VNLPAGEAPPFTMASADLLPRQEFRAAHHDRKPSSSWLSRLLPLKVESNERFSAYYVEYLQLPGDRDRAVIGLTLTTAGLPEAKARSSAGRI
jgi:hypothetical protein